MIAAGLGGPAVAAILAALCLNHKHFGGGLPDLLLMRAVRTGGDAIIAVREDDDAISAAKGGESTQVGPPPAPDFVAALGAEAEVSTVRAPRQEMLFGAGAGREGGRPRIVCCLCSCCACLFVWLAPGTTWLRLA